MPPSPMPPRPATLEIFAVLVLYGMDLQGSAAYCSLERARRERADLRERIGLLVWDNSRPSHEAPEDFDGEFRADSTNPGLAEAYGYALAVAEQRRVGWLMLLDQDTEVTEAYLDEALQAAAVAEARTAALVPRLRHRGVTVSPFLPRVAGPPKPWVDGVPRAGYVQAFNSGAVLRVAALREAGGFDSRFPLDYLDHATFAALQKNGGWVEVLRATLGHDLSTDTGRAATPGERERQRSILAAEARFYRIYGSGRDRLLHPVRLLRRALSVLAHKRDRASAMQILRSMVGTEGSEADRR